MIVFESALRHGTARRDAGRNKAFHSKSQFLQKEETSSYHNPLVIAAAGVVVRVVAVVVAVSVIRRELNVRLNQILLVPSFVGNTLQ